MRKRETLIIHSDPSDITKNRGHDYGKGRQTAVHHRKSNRRPKDKLRTQILDELLEEELEHVE